MPKASILILLQNANLIKPVKSRKLDFITTATNNKGFKLSF